MARNLKLEVVLQAIDRATKPIKAISGGATGLARTLKQTRDAMKGLQAQQQDVSSWRTLRTASEQTERALQSARDRVKALGRDMAATGVPTRQMQRDMRGAIREATALKQQHQQQQVQLQGLRSKLDAAGISTRNLGEGERALRQRIADTNRSLTDQESRLRRVTQQQERLARAKRQYERTQSTAGSMAAGGAGGLATGYSIGRPLLATLGAGVEFDTTMARVQALTRLDKGADELAMLRKQARELGATTLFTSTQVAEGQAFLGMAGFDPEKIKAAMPGILDMAKAGGMDIGETADIGSNILTGMNLQADQMAQVADVITAAFTRSNTSISTLGETMKYAAPGAAQFGVDLETTAAMAAKLGDAGIQGSMGGTSIRRMIGRLASPNKSAREALQKLGVTAQDAQGNMRNLPEVLQEIYDKSRNMGDIERGSLWKAIAGETGSNAMGILVDQAGSGKLQELITILKASEGEAAQVAKTMADNFAGDWDQLKSAWSDVGIELFEGQNSALRELAQNITGVIRKIGGWIKENPQLAGQIVKTIAGLALLTTAMGGLSLMLASVLGPFAIVRYAMTLLGIKSLGLVTGLKAVGGVLLWLGKLALANPIGLLIAALVVGAVLIYKNWDAVKAYMLGLWAELQAGFSGGLGNIAATIVNFSPLGLFHRALAGVLSYFGIDIPARFTEFGGMLIDGLVGGITAGLGRVKDAITGAGGAAVDWFKQKLGIHSPSRVFADLGGFTMAGLTQGLVKGEGSVLNQIAHTADQLTGGMLGAGSDITFDGRPPLPAQGRQAASSGSATYNITVNAAPGQDAQAIARAVAQELDKRERAKAARQRSALYDQD